MAVFGKQLQVGSTADTAVSLRSLAEMVVYMQGAIERRDVELQKQLRTLQATVLTLQNAVDVLRQNP